MEQPMSYIYCLPVEDRPKVMLQKKEKKKELHFKVGICVDSLLLLNARSNMVELFSLLAIYARTFFRVVKT